MRVITLNMSKGGTSKSTLVRNLAHGCAREGLRTIVVDADPQHTLTATMRVEPVDALKALLEDDTIEWQDVLVDVPAEFTGEREGNFSLLPTFTGLAQIEKQSGIEDRIVDRFLELQDYADVVIVDTAPGGSNLHIGLYRVSHGLLLPVLCSIESVLGLTLTLNALYNESQVSPVAPVMGVIPTQFKASENTQQVNYQFMVDHYSQYGRVFPVIRYKTIWSNAAQERKSLYLMAEHPRYAIRREAKIAIAEMQPVLDTILKAVRE